MPPPPALPPAQRLTRLCILNELQRLWEDQKLIAFEVTESTRGLRTSQKFAAIFVKD